jgi:hypothetical protein
MARQLTLLLAGLLFGAGLTFVFVRGAPLTDSPDSAPPVVRDIIDIPAMSTAEADAHRADRFDRIKTIEDTLALPGDFSQTEALYVLAGRADSAAVQELIHQANRIADPTDRNAAISILFLRLAELDPMSALTMSRMRGFTSSRGLEEMIWRTWSKLDLEAALDAARQLDNPAEKNLAAQTMLAAYGYMGNEFTERIESELGVRASNAARARYIYSIADRSVSEAFAYVDTLPLSQQREALQWLAAYLGQRNPSQALGYASLISHPALRREFEAGINSAIARLEPERVLSEMPAGALQGRRAGQYLMAMQTLAQSDIERALAFYNGVQSRQTKQMLANVIVAELARQDVDRAIEWAQNEQQGGHPGLLMGVLQQVAMTDPDLALSKIDLVTNREWRQQMLGSVLSAVAQNDPQRAVAYLSEISDQRARNEATQSVVMQWANTDPQAAIDWILRNEVPNARELLSQAGHNMIANDVDAAMRLLPRLDDQTAQMWRYQIASRLPMDRSPAEAQRFVDQFKGEPGYEDMQAAMIAGVAQQDIYLAHRLADQLPPGQARDQSLQQLISNHVYSDPREAATWLDSISDTGTRGQATGQVLRQWYAIDAHAANQWIMSQPAGQVRDDAVLVLAHGLDQYAPSPERLLATIGDPAKRRQAEYALLMRIAQSDPSRARSMIASMDLSPEERRQLESQLSMMQGR